MQHLVMISYCSCRFSWDQVLLWFLVCLVFLISQNQNREGNVIQHFNENGIATTTKMSAHCKSAGHLE